MKNNYLLFKIFNLMDILRRILPNYHFNSLFHKLIMKWLRNNFKELIEKYNEDNDDNDDINDKMHHNEKVRVMWWQGIDNAPEVVKLCYKQLKKEFSNVTLITKDNFKDYLDLEPYVLKKFDDGFIGMPCFSDIMRVNLLYKYGGVWIDSTCFIHNLDKRILSDNVIFTPKGKDFFNYKYVPSGKWRGFFLKANKNDKVMGFLKSFFNEYWLKENYMVNFFLIDYIFEIAYQDNIGDFRTIINNIPKNNDKLYELDKLMVEDKDIDINEIKENSIFKLNWKHKYSQKELKSLRNYVYDG